MNPHTLDQRLLTARMTLLVDFPFFGQLALRLLPIITTDTETADTDGVVIRFNPDFCATLGDKELAWLYAHEVSHPALGHLWRIGARDLDKVNRAADYVVNEMLESIIAGQSGAKHRLQRVNGALIARRYFGLSMEEIYTMLPDDKNDPSGPNPGQGPIGTFTKPAPPKKAEGEGDEKGNGEGKAPGDEKGPGDGKMEGSGPPQPSPNLEQEWKQAAAEAATVARSRNQGNLPGALEELLKELFEPAVPWQDVLRQYVSRICRDDYTFKRVNRRFSGQGVCLPSLRSDGLGVLAVAVDTSGSIKCDDELLKTFLSELQGILDTCAPERLHMLDCDRRVHSHTEFVPGDDLRGTVFHGGGGTSFVPVFEWLTDNDVTPDVLIYLTDLEGRFPDEAPPYPCLWLNYGSPRLTAPFGETLQIPKS